MKSCSKCKTVKPLEEYYRSSETKDGLYRHCKACQNAATRKWCQEHKERANELARNFHWRHRDKRLAYLRSYYSENQERETRKAIDRYRKNRDAALSHYGNACQCCGEATREFLCIDHVNNDGYLHRREINQTRIADWLKANSYPEGFQVLCFNCNQGKRLYGKCPHELQYGLRIVEV